VAPEQLGPLPMAMSSWACAVGFQCTLTLPPRPGIVPLEHEGHLTALNGTVPFFLAFHKGWNYS